MTDWDDMLQRHGPRVWRMAQRLLGNAHDADECLQEVLIAVWEYSLSHPIRHWPAFFQRTLANKALDRLRQRARRPDAAGGLPSDTFVPSREPTPEQHLIGRELADWLRWALTRLPAEEVEVVCLCCLEGFEHREVAEVLGINVSTVGVRLHRARNRLRGMMISGAQARREVTP